ncbi:hypothetical protein PILCRDRAFT_811602 [Piloderma croceum F 1598]|uniref:Uncharacterized protein n=1 Tax=Piloderma croceum (strain F 1598) TaxID=765440 RepID=A0A0C3GKG7_PILCF|nr:hypothetical protein PILCRDRAFT_811602 [Piloderma croceum F 1598]
MKKAKFNASVDWIRRLMDVLDAIVQKAPEAIGAAMCATGSKYRSKLIGKVRR